MGSAWRSSSSLVRHSTTNQSLTCAPPVQSFVPVTRQPPSARSARVCTEARSLPAPGSLIPIENDSSPAQIAGRKRSFCASEPTRAMTGPVWRSATQWNPTGAPQRSSSSTTTKRSTAVRSCPP